MAQRRENLFIALAFYLLVSVATAHGDSSPPDRISIKTNERVRTALVHFPNRIQRANLPVVLVLHGGGGNATGARQMSQMDSKADAAGFIAVYPEGNPALKILGAKFETWNAGRCCGSAVEDDNDDIGFISLLIDELVRTYKADKTRIYATGISNGAQMSYRLACELAQKIAAIAPVGSVGVTRSCSPTRVVPILHIHGTADPCALYDGGTCGGCIDRLFGREKPPEGSNREWTCDSVPDYIESLRERYRCGAPENVPAGTDSVECTMSKCKERAEIILCTVIDGGHTWPGGRSPVIGCDENTRSKKCTRYDKIVGETSQHFIATDAIWDFFLRHRLITEHIAEKPIHPQSAAPSEDAFSDLLRSTVYNLY